MEDSHALGDRLRSLRESKGMTQADLGQRIGLSQTSVAQIETGVTAMPRRGTLLKICEFFNVSEVWLRTGSEPFFPGSETSVHGSGKMPDGGLAALLGPDFGEDKGGKGTATKVPTNAQGFIKGLLAEIESLKKEGKTKDQVILEQRSALTEAREALKESRINAQFLRERLSAKTEGSQQEAPVTYAVAAEPPIKPIGFTVRQMYDYANLGVALEMAA